MANIFLGKASHWILIVVLIVILYSVGLTRLHVTHFNSFIALLLLLVTGLIIAFRQTTGHGDKITRDT